MTTVILIGLFILSAIGAFLFAGVETATLAVNRQTLKERLGEAGEESDQAFALVSDMQRALAVTLVGVNACTLFGAFALHTALRGWLPPGPIPGGALILTVLVATPVFLLAADALARPLVRRRAGGFLIWMRFPMRASVALMVPLLRGCTRVAAWVLKPFGIEKPASKRPMTVGRLLEIIGEPEKRGTKSVSEREMIYGAIDLERSTAREVMRPLVDVVAVKAPESTVATVLDMVRATGYSRYPVFRNRIVKMTHYVDVNEMLRDGRLDGPLGPYLKPALIVPETMRIDVLLRTLTEHREHCAIVVDEFGGVAGWVTREDVLEEIVGDIADKDADEEPGWSRDAQGLYRVEARFDLDDLNAAIGSRLAKGDDFDTLGGWLYKHIGRVPQTGESVEADGARVRVEEMLGHQIVRATVELTGEPRAKTRVEL